MINAMKKALDALEREQVMAQDNNGDYTINITPKHITEAIGDLREALSQAVEQEPVGYRYKVTTDRGDTVWTFDPFAFTPVLETQRLYTRPAPAKPLSDEQFNDLVMEHLGPHALTGGKMSVYDAFLLAVRATEAAHGIKETS